MDARWQPVEPADLDEQSHGEQPDIEQLDGEQLEGEQSDGDQPELAERFDAADLPEPPYTGEPGVDEALARLASVTGATLEEQLPVLESVHRTLQDRLADVDG